MYWVSMVTYIWSLLVVEEIEKLVLPTDIFWVDDFHHPFEEITNDLQHPLSEDWMVLSTIRL